MHSCKSSKRGRMDSKLKPAQTRSSTGKRCQHLTQLLRNLIIGTVTVSSTCWLHLFLNHDAACRRYNAVMEVEVTPFFDNWTASVMFNKGGGTSPEAIRMHTDYAALTLQNTQATFSRKAGRGRVVVFLMPPVNRGSFREGGTQACLPPWYVHGACVAFYAAGCSSECRHGEGKNKGVEVWARRGV